MFRYKLNQSATKTVSTTSSTPPDSSFSTSSSSTMTRIPTLQPDLWTLPSRDQNVQKRRSRRRPGGVQRETDSGRHDGSHQAWKTHSRPWTARIRKDVDLPLSRDRLQRWAFGRSDDDQGARDVLCSNGFDR